MSRPKSYGGLGFKDLRLFNQALLAHQAWRPITYLNSLCCQVLKAKYFHNSNLLDMAPASAASATWRAIEYGIELLKHGAINRVGDGESTRIWRDNWIPRVPNMKPSGPIRACRLRCVSHLLRRGSNEWDEGTLRRYFFPWDVDEILKIRLPATKRPDWVTWQYEKTGLFTVRSAYRLALERAQNLNEVGTCSAANGERRKWCKIWKLPVLLKVHNFIWKMLKNGIPTNANRQYRHITNDASCEMCGASREDCFHATMECPHAKTLREAMREVWPLPPEDRLCNTGLEWLIAVLESVTESKAANLAMILWRSWTVRNKVTRAGEALSIVSSVEYLMNLDKCLKEPGGDEYTPRVVCQDQVKSEPRRPEGTDSSWRPPDPGNMKVNTDAAFNQATGAAAIGIIARHHEGQPQFMAWRVIGQCRDAKEAEAMALLEGVRMVDCWPDNIHVDFETDCADLVRKVVGRGRDCSMISAPVGDIQEIMAKRALCKVRRSGGSKI
jgi:hypothetical protein